MRSKKIILAFIIVSIIIIAVFFNPFSAVSTTSDITILEKGHSKDNKEAWIIAFNPNAPKEHQEKIKILVKEPMVWNLIEENKTYFVTYSKKRNDLRVLNHIENIGDNKALR